MRMAIHPGENLGLLIRYAMPSASQPLELGRSKDPPSKPYNVRQFPLLSNFVGKGSDATRPPQSELSLVQLPP